MEEKNIIKIKLSTAICITVITILLIGLVVLLGMYYFKNNTENEELQPNNNQLVEQENDKTITLKEEIDDEPKTEQLDINDELVQKLYKYIPIADNIAEYNENKIIPKKTAYQSNKIKINDLENQIKLINTFKNLELREDEKTYVESDWYYFASELLESKALEIYGKNVNITNETFDIAWGASCVYENNKYMYSYGGGGPASVESIREIKEAYIENDLLYIIDRFMFGITMENGENYEETYNLYTNTEINELIAKEDEWQEKNILMNKYRDKMAEYKHTFKKGDNGEYYWYSSEPLNK